MAYSRTDMVPITKYNSRAMTSWRSDGPRVLESTKEKETATHSKNSLPFDVDPSSAELDLAFVTHLLNGFVPRV